MSTSTGRTGSAASAGGPSDEEIAAVVAALISGRSPDSAPLEGYELWRRQRLAALRSGRTRARSVRL